MKKIILGLFLGLVMLVGVNVAHGATTCEYNSATSATCVDDTNNFRLFYYDSGAYTGYISNNAGVPMLINGTTAPMIVDVGYTHGDVRIYSFDSACVLGGHYSSTADPDFCGVMEFDLPLDNQQFSDSPYYVAPTTPMGIGIFKTGAGAYTSSNMISQTATALQATIGENGLGSILAIIGGLLVAFGVILWVVSTFKEAGEKNTKKTRKI